MAYPELSPWTSLLWQRSLAASTISPRLTALNTIYTLRIPQFIAWASLLNSKLTYPASYSTSPSGELISFSNLTCSKVSPWSSSPSQLMTTPSSQLHRPKSYNHLWFFSHTHIPHPNPPENSTDYTFKVYQEPNASSIPSLQPPLSNHQHLAPGITP